MDPSLVVSLHDVSPQTWEPCARILDELHRLGVGATSLLVIPNHHHRGHFLQDAGFCAWLNAQAAKGHEIVLHGYHHQRAPRDGENLRDRVVTRSYTAGEGEFYDLTYDAATALLTRGRSEFQQAGLHLTGFIAPAWLLSAEGERAARDLGFDYTTRLRGVWDFRRNRVHPSQSLCWSVRANWRRLLSLIWNAHLFHRLAKAPLLRVAIHPVDLAHRRIWTQITRLVTASLRARQAMTYQDWLARYVA